MAIVHRLEHIQEEESHLPRREALLRPTRRVQPTDLLTKAAVRVILCDEVDVAVGVADDLVEPDQVRMLQLLEYFHLLENHIGRRHARVAKLFLSKNFTVHLLHCVFLLGLRMHI